MNTNDLIAFGGLDTFCTDSVALRKKQIEGGFLLHTCNDYGESLEVISTAAKECQIRPRLILKTYFNYPDTSNRRFRPILEQIEEALTRLNHEYDELILQCSCFYPANVITGEKIIDFCSYLKNEFGISKYFFEACGIYKYLWPDFVLMKKRLGNDFFIGLAGYQNFYNRTFSERDISFFKSHAIPICQIGFLGKGKKDRNTAHLLEDNSNLAPNLNNYLLGNIAYLIENIKEQEGSIGVTSVSSPAKYEQLMQFVSVVLDMGSSERAQLLQQMAASGNINYFFEDHYGGVLRFNKLSRQPKLIIKRLSDINRRRKMDPFLTDKYDEKS